MTKHQIVVWKNLYHKQRDKIKRTIRLIDDIDKDLRDGRYSKEYVSGLLNGIKEAMER